MQHFGHVYSLGGVGWREWIKHLAVLDMTLEEENHLRTGVEHRLLTSQCRQMLVSGNRSAAWKFARQLPFSGSKVKWILSLVIPTRVVQSLATF